MDTEQVAEYLGVTTGRVRQLAIDNDLPGERIGTPGRGVWVFRVEDVEAYSKRRRRRGRPSKEDTKKD